MINIFYSLFIVLNFASLGSNQSNLFNKKNVEMKIKIGSKEFIAILYDNPTAEKFKKLLPMRIEMKELNNNEKYADIPGNLNTNPINLGKIESGDIMIYDTNTLVLFYKSFRTNYSYTKVGHITDTSNLIESLGHGNVSISFELD